MRLTSGWAFHFRHGPINRSLTRRRHGRVKLGEALAEDPGLARQIAAGRRNANRFVMSLGSPVTPSTSVSRVRRYCDLVHRNLVRCDR